MDYKNDSVLRILRSMGPISMSEFDDRLRLQKLTYLAQELGAGNKYFYSWYAHGPYSSPLTTALFLGKKQNVFDSKPVLTEKESGIVSKLKSLLGRNIYKPSKLELFASVWYLRKISRDDRATVLDVMRREKPHFTRRMVESALDATINFKKSL